MSEEGSKFVKEMVVASVIAPGIGPAAVATYEGIKAVAGVGKKDADGVKSLSDQMKVDGPKGEQVIQANKEGSTGKIGGVTMDDAYSSAGVGPTPPAKPPAKPAAKSNAPGK